jgi:chaperonin GroES
MEVKLQPLGKRLLIKPLEKEEKTKGGLIIPDTAEDKKSSQGTVVKLGLTKKDHVFNVKVGDMVFFKQYSAEEIKIDEEKYLLVEEGDVLAVIK